MRADQFAPAPPSVEQPPGVQRIEHLDRVEIKLKRRKDPGLGMAAMLLVFVGVGVMIAGLAGGFNAAVPLISVVAVASAAGVHFMRKKASKAPAQVVELTATEVRVDGARLAWDDLRAIHRAHGNSGGSILIEGTDGTVLRIGGRLRPSGVDWIERQVIAQRDLAHASGGDVDEPGLSALSEVRGREG